MTERKRTRRSADAEPRRTARDIRRRTHGQNFLRSSTLVKTIVERAGVATNDLVVEPGAGTGSITKHLATRAARVVAIEIDPDWCRKLEERFADFDNVEVRCQDFFKYPLPRRPYRVIGNIPFGVTTKILRHLLDSPRRAPVRTDVIVQLGAARRYARQKPSSALTASWLPWYEFKVVQRIPSNAFRPVPRSDAALLSVKKRSSPLLHPRERPWFTTFVYAGFAGLTVWDGLRRFLTANQVRRLRQHASLGEQTRPASLSVDDWVRLYANAQRFGWR